MLLSEELTWLQVAGGVTIGLALVLARRRPALGVGVIEERVAAAVGRPVRSLRRIQTRGYAQAFHAIAELDGGSTAFVKAGAEDVTSEFLRQEIRFYEAVQGSFMPCSWVRRRSSTPCS